MLINTNYSPMHFIKSQEISSEKAVLDKEAEKLNDKIHDERLRELVSEFTSILLKQMFSSMRKTVLKSDLMDGGFSEEVFTEMLDEEISKKGSIQQGFNNLSRILYEQLKRND